MYVHPFGSAVYTPIECGAADEEGYNLMIR